MTTVARQSENDGVLPAAPTWPDSVTTQQPHHPAFASIGCERTLREIFLPTTESEDDVSLTRVLSTLFENPNNYDTYEIMNLTI